MGISILKDYLPPRRALLPLHARVRWETVPGVQLQHDWRARRPAVPGVRFAVNTRGSRGGSTFIAMPQATRV